jgi:hypothetical protein
VTELFSYNAAFCQEQSDAGQRLTHRPGAMRDSVTQV